MIRAENLCKSYDGLQVLSDINLTVKGGCLCMVTGPSGCGKSTLLNALSRLDSFDSGRLYLSGEKINDIPYKKLARMRRKDIGFIFQSYNLISSMTALENVALPLKYSRQKYFHRRSRAIRGLEKMGLGDKIYSRPHQLSGGQQQRVAVARALVTQPKILFCDEPTGNLDPDSTRTVMEGILSLRDRGAAVVMITHDHSLLSCADVVYAMEKGKLSFL